MIHACAILSYHNILNQFRVVVVRSLGWTMRTLYAVTLITIVLLDRFISVLRYCNNWPQSAVWAVGRHGRPSLVGTLCSRGFSLRSYSLPLSLQETRDLLILAFSGILMFNFQVATGTRSSHGVPEARGSRNVDTHLVEGPRWCCFWISGTQEHW